MNIKEGQEIFIFKNEYVNGDSKRCTYSTSLSKKLENGSYARFTLTVALIGDLKKDFDANMKTTEYVKVKLNEAWIGFDVYQKKDGATEKKICVYVKACSLVEKKECVVSTGKKIAEAEVKRESLF